MKLLRKSWVIPVLPTIAAVIAVLTAGCNNAKQDAKVIESAPEHNINAIENAADNEKAINEASSTVVKTLTDGMNIDMKPAAPIVIDFNATWCGPCQQFAPVYDKVAEKYQQKATFHSCDVDQAPKLAEKFSISSIPTIIVIRPDGSIDRTTGAMSEEAFEKFLNL